MPKVKCVVALDFCFFIWYNVGVEPLYGVCNIR